MKTLLPHPVGSNISISTLCEYTNVDTHHQIAKGLMWRARGFSSILQKCRQRSLDFSNYYFFYSFAAQYSPPPQKKPMETPAPWAVHENEFKYWDRALKI